MGDVETKYSKGDSIYGRSSNFGPNTNGSQFYVTMRTSRWLDGRNVIFGKVLEGMDVLEQIQLEETDSKNAPHRQIHVKDCGVNKITKYTLTKEQFDVDGDVKK